MINQIKKKRKMQENEMEDSGVNKHGKTKGADVHV
jgi:hypothetical protein